MIASSTQTARRIRLGRCAAVRRRTSGREYAATADHQRERARSWPAAAARTWSRPAPSGWPPRSAPARCRRAAAPPTASAAQRDQIGRIAPSSRSSARRSRKTASITSPPSQTAMLPRCTASTTTETAGAGEAAGCPASGQVNSAAPPRMARMIPSVRPIGPAKSGAEQERRRGEQAQPDQVGRAEGAAQHVAQPRGGHVEQPATRRCTAPAATGRRGWPGPAGPARPRPAGPARAGAADAARARPAPAPGRPAAADRRTRGTSPPSPRSPPPGRRGCPQPVSTGGVDGAPTE